MAAAPASYGNSGVKPMGYEAISNYLKKKKVILLMPRFKVTCLLFFSLFSRVMNTGSQFVMEGVKNLVLKQHVSISTLL